MPEKVKDPPKPTGNEPLDAALLELDEFRERHEEAMKPLIDASATNGNRLDELEKQYETQVADLRAIAERLAKFDAPVGMTKQDERKFDMGRLGQALFMELQAKNDRMMGVAWDEAGFEREVIDQARTNQRHQMDELQRLLGTVDDETGGVLVPSDALPDWITLLRSKLVLPTLGARVLTNLVGHRLPIPGLATGATADWYGESDEPTADTPTFKVRYLDPHRVMSFVPVANNLLRWSPRAVRDIINLDMTQALALKIEDGVLFGSGAEDAPLGIIYDTGIGTFDFGTDGARMKIRDVAEFELVLEEANLDIDDSAGFLFHPRVKRLFKKEGVEQFSSQGIDSGQPYVVPGISDAAVAALLGYPYATTTAVPTNLSKGSSSGILTYIFFALWNQCLIGQWGGLRLRASTESGNSALGSAFLKDQTWLVVETLADGLMRRPEALVLSSDANKNA